MPLSYAQGQFYFFTYLGLGAVWNVAVQLRILIFMSSVRNGIGRHFVPPARPDIRIMIRYRLVC
jgi:hypothetical protein